MVVSIKSVRVSSLSLIFISFVNVLFLFSCSSQNENKNIEKEMNYAYFVHVDSLDYNLGVVREDSGFANIEFCLKNQGDKNLYISAIPVACNCLSVNFERKIIYPENDFYIKIQFNPKKRKGYFYRKILIIFNDGMYYMILSLHGTII